MAHSEAVGSVVAVLMLVAVVIGWLLLRRAYARTRLLPEEFALAGAWIFVVGGLVWLEAFINGHTLLGFGEPWTWLAAAHFAVAGYGALTVTALACRTLSDPHALRLFRLLLVLHPVAYFTTAAGISGVAYCSTLGAALYQTLFILQLVTFLRSQPQPDRLARAPGLLLILALTVPVLTLLPALLWAWDRRSVHVADMVRYHGLINAFGHVGLGLVALAWGRPQAHAPLAPQG